MSDYIPDELFPKILACLPAKSLVRFTSVCKSWKSLITSSDFITAHVNRIKLSTANDGNHQLLLLRYYGGNPQKERYSLHFDNDTFELYKELDFPFHATVEPYFSVLGSCNGLICLADYIGWASNINILLWNPSIKKFKALPYPKYTFLTHGPYYDAIGFGFDSRSNDYKVVRLVNLSATKDEPPIIELFKLSAGYWETISATMDPRYHILYNTRSKVFINGAVHWTGVRKYICGAVIMSFDMCDEVFREIKLPASYNYDGSQDVLVAICGEWLSFVDSCKRYRRSSSLWVMKEYSVVESWTKLYTFDINGGIGKTVGFQRNGELLLAMSNGELASYDAETQQIKYLGICEHKQDLRRPDIYSFYVGAYEESLVLLGVGNTTGQDSNVSNGVNEELKEQEKQVL